MISPLEALAATGALHRESANAMEFAGLVRSGRTRLRDAGNRDLSLESRFDLAYNAAHALSLAALRHHGYRSSNRYVVFQALQHTLGLAPAVWRVLDRAHALRNRREYEGELGADERSVAEVLSACKTVSAALDDLPALA